VAFFIPLFASLIIDGVSSELFRQNFDLLLSLFATSTLVFALGVYDDIRGTTVVQKFSVQILAAVIIYFLGFKIDVIAMPFVDSLQLGILGLPVTILWIVGVTNAINFTDGIDGLACGVGFFSVSTIFILSLFLGHSLSAFLAAALAGGLFGFALYNFAPASIFMGDSGSLFIGFIIAAISLYSSQKSSTAVVLLIPIVALGVPITDTILAVIRRVGHGISPFTADKEHIHHRLLNMGLSSRQVTLVLYGVCILLGMTALSMTAVNNQLLALILVSLSVMTIGGIKTLGYTADMVQINALAKERIQQKRRVLQRQKLAEEILTEIENAVDLPTLKKGLIRYFESMEFDTGNFQLFPAHSKNQRNAEPIKAKVSAPQKPGEQFEMRWFSLRYEEQRISPSHLLTISIPLLLDETKYGELSIGKYIASNGPSLELAILVDNLSMAIQRTFARIP
ncbi:MAG: undecaprenyl/decaprenyl-phosphate alpha-N-acetylglucosaminyl 1-phosphate transferase, partial [bacterium]|nr:undecaprenyl/decaprenyl-phosphate alpha-N-acetylglucosaminyl 1-phosphate transferase [bacterium]